MRQRARRDLLAVGGVVAIVAVLVFVNYSFGLNDRVEQMDQARRAVEQERENAGMEILKWRHMRATEGNLRSGATFSEALIACNNKQVNVVGFVVPENTFRDMTEFMLLPLPLDCYFCGRPPVHDIMMIKMAEGTVAQPYEQAVLVNGVLRLHEGPNTKAFYSIEQAALVSAEDGVQLDRREIDPVHMLPKHEQKVLLDEGIELGGES